MEPRNQAKAAESALRPAFGPYRILSQVEDALARWSQAAKWGASLVALAAVAKYVAKVVNNLG